MALGVGGHDGACAWGLKHAERLPGPRLSLYKRSHHDLTLTPPPTLTETIQDKLFDSIPWYKQVQQVVGFPIRSQARTGYTSCVAAGGRG